MTKETPKIEIQHLVKEQHAFFRSQQTKSVDFRLEQLKKLKTTIKKYEKKIDAALWEDLHKSPEEAYLTEISIVLGELDYHIQNLKSWTKPKRVRTPLALLPSTSRKVYEPLGVALIVSPWNYPFQLLFNPLVGAISAGCCAILKSSPDAPQTSKIVGEIIHDCFSANYVALVEGSKETNTYLFEERFDLIFFTGSPRLGKIVMQAAAKHLTPVILELGGKSPCIVDKDANLVVSAKRIVWGKFINAGQTCIAPDYLMVHHSVKKQLLALIQKEVKNIYGDEVKESRFYPRIVSDKAFERLTGLMQQGKIIMGGASNALQRYISPTLIDEVSPEDPIMQEEIFGPLLPVLTFSEINEAIHYIQEHEKPLALYYFGSRNEKKILKETSSGGACINDTLMHIANHHLPFGGVGNSGMGHYHGKYSFEAFSHLRGYVKTPTFIDIPMKYAPYPFFKWLKKIL